jgi:predicted GNAT family N-acyltransferase
LVRDLVATASEQGIRRVEVTANEHARAFYESVGFIDDGITHTRFGPAPRMYLDIA